MRPALARGVAAAAVILAVVVALMTLSYVRVDSTTPFARRYGLRQAPLRRSRGGALRTRLRVGAAGVGVVSPREDDVFSLVAPGEGSGLQAYGMLGAVVVADADPPVPEDVVMLLASTNLVAGKARNYAWASVLAPGSRVDLFARCDAPATLRSAKRGALAYYLGGGSDVFDGEILDVVPTPSRRPDQRRAPAAPRGFRSLLGERPDRVATLAYYDGASVVRDGNAYTDYGLRVVDGDGSVDVGDVVEWTLHNDVKHGGPEDTNHPFHLHTNHFQIVDLSHWLICTQVDLSHGEGVDYAVGDWRDTITLPTPGWVKIRFRAADYDGPSLAHCHIFSHSDLGMQHKFDIGTGGVKR
ncbi:multicopper oxidase [Aureococcus anophagefferens]|nr:multicopper oxidase [Aureococcus anophagefferens]